MSKNSPDQLNNLLSDIKLRFDKEHCTMDKSVNKFLWKFNEIKCEIFLQQLNRSKNLAEIECKNIASSDMYNILQQIQLAIDFEADQNVKQCGCKAINALNHIPLYDVLIHCLQHIRVNSSEITLLVDDNRTELIEYLFGIQPKERITNPDSNCLENFHLNLISPEAFRESITNRFDTNQIIFDSSDYLSAFDALVRNLVEPVNLPWRIKTVFVQETLRDFFFNFISVETSIFQDNTTRGADKLDDFCKELNLLIKRTNGKLFQNNSNTISLLVNVPTNSLSTSLSMHGAVTVNFFRTPKEICQRINNEKYAANAIKFTSIWTENISVLYDVALSVKSNAIWNNCYGIFGAGFLCPTISSNCSSVKSDGRLVFKNILAAVYI